MLQLSPRSTIALVGSSDGLPRDSDTVSRLCAVLESLGLHTVIFHPYTRLLPASRSRQNDAPQTYKPRLQTRKWMLYSI